MDDSKFTEGMSKERIAEIRELSKRLITLDKGETIRALNRLPEKDLKDLFAVNAQDFFEYHQ